MKTHFQYPSLPGAVLRQHITLARRNGKALEADRDYFPSMATRFLASGFAVMYGRSLQPEDIPQNVADDIADYALVRLAEAGLID